MAAQADGIILINTAINKDGAIEDIGALKDALRELTAVVKELTKGLTNSLTGAGKQATKAADQIESISDSAKDAKDSVQSLKEQMDKISVSRGEQSGGLWDEEERISHTRGEFQDYGNTVQQFVNDYADGMDKVEKSTNEFKNEITTLTKQLKDLESQGLYFGDDQYDETYMKLSKIKQALADYKKEMLSPAESPKINIESLQGQVDSLKLKLRKLTDQGKTFGDELYDSTYTALKKSESVLKDYQKKLSTPEKVKIDIDESSLQGKVDLLKQQLNQLMQAGKTFGDGLYDSTYQALNKAQAELTDYKKNLVTPVKVPIELDKESFEFQKQQLKAELLELEKQGVTLGNPEYDELYAELQRVTQAEKEYKKSLTATDKEQKKVASSGKKMNASMRSTRKEANPLAKSILSLSGMLRLMLIRMAMRAAIQSAKDGFENLARYSGNANKAVSSLMSAMTQLKNSSAVAFAPIVEVVSPILSMFISKLAEVNNWIGQTMAALAGKDTFVKAVAVQEDYAASLSDTQKAAKEAAKEVKKASFAFDTLMQIQKSADTSEYKGPTPDQMFKTIAVGTEAKALAEDIKSTLANLFEPLKASWDQYGASTTNAAKTMLGSLKQLAKDVGASFMQVWKDEGYGKAITNDLLITLSNLALTVANLADQFDKAWINANTGTSIMRHLGDIVLLVTGFFREASESIKNWSATLDFSPLLKSFDSVLASLIPIVSKIGDALLWLLNNVLLPLAKWAIEKALPVGLDLVSAALQVLNSIIDALKPLAIWLWEDFIQPFGKWTGEVIITALKKVVEWLTKFSDWISQHQEAVRNVTVIVLAFFAAWKFVEFMTGIKNMLSVLPNLISVFGSLLGKLNPLVVVLGSIIAIAAYVAMAWDKMTPSEKLASKIIAVAGAIALVVAAIAAGIQNYAMLAVAGAVAAIAGFSLVGIAAGANSRSSNSRSVPSYASTGYASFASVMPRLATGTVVPPKAGEFAAILGDNNKDYEVVSPLETMKQAFKEAIGEMGGIGGGTVQADMIVDGTKFGQLVYKYNNNEKQRVGVRMVTTGG